jgi:mannose-6-phosphate isomerase-like protein (cupin superfamily)
MVIEPPRNEVTRDDIIQQMTNARSPGQQENMEGDSVSIPAGTRHCWKNTSRGRCQISIVSPR